MSVADPLEFSPPGSGCAARLSPSEGRLWCTNDADTRLLCMHHAVEEAQYHADGTAPPEGSSAR